MKKLLLLVSILAVSGITFAATTSSDTTGTVDVRAEVVTQLEIVDTTPVDFGRIAAGQENKPEEKSGSFTIVGSSGKNIKITVRDENKSGSQYIDPSNGIDVVLYQDGSLTTITNKQMISKLFLYNNSAKVGNSPLTFGSKANYYPNGNNAQPKTKLPLDVKGTLTAGINQDIGNYQGILGIKAVYTDPVIKK